MKEQLINFETAKLAKGRNIIFENMFPFNYSCYLNNGNRRNSDAFKKEEKLQDHVPTQSLLQTWLRDKHNIHVTASKDIVNKLYSTEIDVWNNIKLEESLKLVHFNSYEEALENGLQEALKLI
jgi:hypothetical protein